MKAVLLKVSLNDTDSDEECLLNSVAVSLDQIKSLVGLSQIVLRSTIEGSIELDSDVVNALWIDELEERAKLSMKELGQVETDLEENGYFTEKEIEVKSGVEVENFTVGMNEDGVYLLCDYKGSTYSTDVFLNEDFLDLENEEDEEEEEAE